jgi:hypothetical protein
MLDWILSLFRPDPRVMALVEARLEPPAWWTLHVMSTPMPPSLSARGEAVRQAFLAPFLLHAAKLHYADAMTRAQARQWWNVATMVKPAFWESLDTDITDWPGGTWGQVRDHLFAGTPLSVTPAPSTVSATALSALNDHRQAMLAEGHDVKAGQVFVTRQGKFIEKSNLGFQIFHPILKETGLASFRIHDLRHTHASHLLHAGASLQEVSRRLGHYDEAFTLKTYAHLLPSSAEELRRKLDELYG